MSTIDLKNIIVQQILSIQNESFLQDIKKILDAKTELSQYQTTEEQKKSIYQSLSELDEGYGIFDQVVNEDIQKWLKEK